MYWVMFLFIFGGASFYVWNNIRNRDEDPRAVQKEVTNIMQSVARHMVLPQGAQPTVATVKDPEQLKEQLFFANAKIGDKVLIYTDARKAILYRPSEDKIIEVAPLSIGE